MKIWSTMKIEGRFTAEIDVPDTNPETIKKAMATAYAEADFGELSDIDGSVVAIPTPPIPSTTLSERSLSL